jgi:hypothetical protein
MVWPLPARDWLLRCSDRSWFPRPELFSRVACFMRAMDESEAGVVVVVVVVEVKVEVDSWDGVGAGLGSRLCEAIRIGRVSFGGSLEDFG